MLSIGHNHMRLFLLAASGGGIGVGARYLVNVTCAGWLGAAFPWSTFIINVDAGSVVLSIGRLLAGLSATRAMLP